MKKLLYILLFAGSALNAQTVDLGIHPVLQSPLSNCDLENETLTVTIFKTTGPPFGGAVEIGYSIDGAPAVTYSETLPLMVGTWIYSFADNIDFSACQEHNVIVWIYTPNDIDNSNDTAYFQIISDCSSSSSFISPSDNCYSIGDTLFLNNYQGNVVAWEASIDNGTNWTSISTPSDWYNPSNNIPIMVRTIVESPFGLCETDTILFNAPYNDFLMGVEAGSDTTIFLGDSMQLDGIGGTSFSWYPTSFLSNSAIANPVIWPDTSTVFYLESSDGSCSGIDSIVVTVVDVSQIYSEHENDLIIPNFLAKSSTWIIEGIWDYPENRILIYNLSGQLIYSANPYTNEFNVAHIPTGTYIYLINLGKDKQRIRGKIIVLN